MVHPSSADLLLGCATPPSEPPRYLRVSPVDAIGGSTNGSTMANRRVPYLYTKRGVFYLQKRVPADLQHRYGRLFIRKSLRTKDLKQANRLASSLVDGLERKWLDLRFGISEETPASDLLLLQRATFEDATLAINMEFDAGARSLDA